MVIWSPAFVPVTVRTSPTTAAAAPAEAAWAGTPVSDPASDAVVAIAVAAAAAAALFWILRFCSLVCRSAPADRWPLYGGCSAPVPSRCPGTAPRPLP
jgi:hypothetical protein